MIDEAKNHGLTFTTQTVNQLAWGVKRKGSPFDYVPPNADAKLHDSLKGAWRLLEHRPKRDKYRECPDRKSFLGYYIPRGEPRQVPSGSTIHESAVAHFSASGQTWPTNLPKDCPTEPGAKPPDASG